MLITIDIGNTNVTCGIFNGNEIKKSFRISSVKGRTIDELEMLLRTMAQGFVLKTGIIASVVPDLTSDYQQLLKERFSIVPVIVGPGIKTGLDIKIDDPRSLGADRIVNAVAAKKLFGTPALVIDFGTATTFDFVDKSGAYRGGIIAPGIEVSLQALVGRTAKLSSFELTFPDKVVGTDTVSAMRSGIVLGYSLMIDSLITAVQQESGDIPHIISTGGLAQLFSRRSKHIKEYHGDLTLWGLKFISDINDR